MTHHVTVRQHLSSIAALHGLLDGESSLDEEVLELLHGHVLGQVGHVKSAGRGTQVTLETGSGLVVAIPKNRELGTQAVTEKKHRLCKDIATTQMNQN